MLAELSRAPARMRVNFILTCLFLAALLVFGGASRADALSLPIARLAAVAMIAIAAVQLDAEDWRTIRTPALFLGAVAAIIAVQLIPLPPGLWASLPGRAFYVDAMQAAGVGDGWRPLSLTPDLTLNALLAILPPLAAVLALGTIDRAFHRLLVLVLLGAVAVNGAVGLLQISSGGPYFYSITNEGAAVGFFSNRNHLALFMAMALPLLACWAALPHADPSFRRLRSWIALCAGAAIFPLLLASGSRAGLILGVVGALLAFGIRMASRRSRSADADPAGRRPSLLALLPLLIGIAAIAAAVFASRDVALRRLIQGEEMEQRTAYLPTYFDMIRDYFPVGSGFGSFDTVFRAYEPTQTLTVEYMNQAHNDWVQLLIEGGVTPLFALVPFLLWFAVRSWRLWTRKLRSPAELMARTGSAAAFLVLLSSAVDYPLRTPFLAALMAIVCCWMLPARESPDAEKTGRKDGLGSKVALE